MEQNSKVPESLKIYTSCAIAAAVLGVLVAGVKGFLAYVGGFGIVYGLGLALMWLGGKIRSAFGY